MGDLTNAPADRRYSREHEWLQMVEDGKARVGITDYAANELGSVVFVVLPAVGDRFGQSEKFGEIESVKSVSDLFIPAGGEVTAVNTALADDPEVINGNPFGAGWILELRLDHPQQADGLLTAEEYAEFVKTL